MIGISFIFLLLRVMFSCFYGLLLVGLQQVWEFVFLLIFYVVYDLVVGRVSAVGYKIHTRILLLADVTYEST